MDGIYRVPESLMADMLSLPDKPDRPLTGPGHARMRFPDMRGRPVRYAIWIAIPVAHKEKLDHYISPEVFRVLMKHDCFTA